MVVLLRLGYDQRALLQHLGFFNKCIELVGMLMGLRAAMQPLPRWNCHSPIADTMKLVLAFVLFVFCSLPAFAQDLDWLSDDSLDARFGRCSMEIVGTDSEGHWLVIPTWYSVAIELTDHQLDLLRSWRYEDWMLHLEDEKTDFITNLLLYSRCGRDAWLLKDTNRDAWRRHHKEEEIAYWQMFLSDHDGEYRW